MELHPHISCRLGTLESPSEKTFLVYNLPQAQTNVPPKRYFLLAGNDKNLGLLIKSLILLPS